MTYAADLSDTRTLTSETNSYIKRFGVLTYGLLAYGIGCLGLFWLILAMGGLAPVSLSTMQSESVLISILTNIGLIVLFGLQHSIMARPGFKDWLNRYIPTAAERSTFMFMSGVVTIIAIYFWQPLPGTVWNIENPVVQISLWSVYALAWVYLLTATFITNHFELMGLRQVYLYFKKKPYTALPFTRKFMYRYSRHPMMLGFLVGMWSSPYMSISHFVMAALLTVYIAVGIMLEERDLINRFGNTYRKYKKEIATFIPGMY